jgi:hypothetical protein
MDKEKESVPLSAHKEELESIFFSLKEVDAEISNVESNVEEDDDKELEEDKASDKDPIETVEKDQRAALDKLSKVKKYKLSPMALQDLNIVGREMLGQHLRDISKQPPCSLDDPGLLFCTLWRFHIDCSHYEHSSTGNCLKSTLGVNSNSKMIPQSVIVS